MAASALTLEVSPEVEDLSSQAEGSDMNLFAFKLWQRASCSEKMIEQDWLSPEECVFIPH